MKIATDRRRNEVVVRMDPEEARALAAFLDDELPPRDLVRVIGDLDELRDAADRLEPRPEPAP